MSGKFQPVPTLPNITCLPSSVDIHATVADINGPLAGLQEDYEAVTEVEMEEAEEEEKDEKVVETETERSMKPHRGRGKNNLFKNQRRRNKKNLRKKNKI